MNLRDFLNPQVARKVKAPVPPSAPAKAKPPKGGGWSAARSKKKC